MTDSIFEKQDLLACASLQRAFEAQIQAVAGGGGLPAILDQATQVLRRCDLIIAGSSAEVIEQRGHHFSSEFSSIDLPELVGATDFEQSGQIVFQRGRVRIHRIRVRFVGRTSIFLLCVTDRQLNDDELRALDQCRLGVLLARTYGAANEKLDRRNITSLYEAVFNGTAEVSRITEVLGLHGIDAIEGVRVIAFAADSLSTQHDVIGILEEKRHIGIPLAVGEVNGEIFCVVNSADRGHSERLLAGTLRKDKGSTSVGVSHPHRSVGQLRRAMLEARIALSEARRVGHGVSYAEDTVISTVLASLFEHDTVQYLMSRYIDPISDYDRRNDGELLPTLARYVGEGFRPGVSADALFIHRQTLKYRLDRITKVTGLDPRDPGNMLEYILAVKLHEEFPAVERRSLTRP
ncbi:PucR family transcriptional regulator (plasmid) [Arthrobacter sp. KN11-1C]|uniref:PucR family transcriptional regulator n=1 Tax=Arthrobacter sp. KN11-1C TaxID=3445774 RepID=UPI003F9F2839